MPKARPRRIAPDDDRAYFVVSQAHMARHQYSEAEDSIRRAIEINSWNAGYFGQLAVLHLAQYRWQQALETADQGLAIEPDDEFCLNGRAKALTKLGRHDEAASTLVGALEKHPEDSFSHANRGWTLLHENEPQKAIEFFRESLRLDPTSEWAKEGLLEAMRAKSWFYRRIMQVYFWLSRFSPRMQFAFLFGLYFVAQFVRWIGEQAPPMKPFLTIVLLGYVGFVVSMWFAKHIRNVALLLSHDGRLLLTRSEKWISSIAFALITTTVILGVLGFISDDVVYLEWWIIFLLVSIHFASVFEIPYGRYFWIGLTASLVVISFAGMKSWDAIVLFEELARFEIDAISFTKSGDQIDERAYRLKRIELDSRWNSIKKRMVQNQNTNSTISILSIGALILHMYLRKKATSSMFL